jgi:hypothetical protein
MTHNEQPALEEGTITISSFSEQWMWKCLWKLDVVPKVHVFRWRVLRGILLVESILKHRHIAQIARCKICLDVNEHMMYALIQKVLGRGASVAKTNAAQTTS